MSAFPFYQQLDAMDCGPSCLRMIAKHHGKVFSLEHLREISFIDREGVSLLGISEAAEQIGFHTLAGKINYDTLVNEAEMPVVVHWKQRHFMVVYKATKKKVWVADPASGKYTLSKEEFLKGWISDQDRQDQEGVVLILTPTPDFFQQEGDAVSKGGWSFLWRYVMRYKKLLFQLVLGLILGAVLQLIFPFLTQTIVDIGIRNSEINFITLILLAQLMLFLSYLSVEFIRGWILLHIGNRVNISLISDFLIKLMRLPIKFFDTKLIGDLVQRINDHARIKEFLTSSALNSLFSVFSLFVFSIVLFIYSKLIFFVFIIGTVLYVLWIMLFMRKRKELDYRKFDEMADNQNTLIQMLQGMQEIKLQNCDKQKRWEWENIQAKLFRLDMKSLAVDQYQQAGASAFNEVKNILIAFIAAKSVIEGSMTLGMMLAVQYIIGQLNGPINQLINFFRIAQDAKISLERLNEIHQKKNEEDFDTALVNFLPVNSDIELKNISFRYGGPHSAVVLKNINLTIPKNKITAIVGTSGSGKTTLIKLLLKFYAPNEGEIMVGEVNLKNIRNRYWRSECGAVMQDGFIFSDTIADNIAVSAERVDVKKLLDAVQVANIQEFIESMPLSYNTKIGAMGNDISQGQKQRILIARTVYKDPKYIFFDEATNSLDANNERTIMANLDSFFVDRTVVVVAHRLSTVKNADQIIVLDRGEIVERGTHSELTAKRGAYYNLVKNQLELGS